MYSYISMKKKMRTQNVHIISNNPIILLFSHPQLQYHAASRTHVIPNNFQEIFFYIITQFWKTNWSENNQSTRYVTSYNLITLHIVQHTEIDWQAWVSFLSQLPNKWKRIMLVNILREYNINKIFLSCLGLWPFQCTLAKRFLPIFCFTLEISYLPFEVSTIYWPQYLNLYMLCGIYNLI